MQYFNSLPLTTQNSYNVYGNNQVVTNLITRAYLLPELQKNIMMFYQYDIKDGETPESISYNYYNNVYRYWLILYANNITDPLGDWPKTNRQLDLYLEDKYKEQANGTNIIAYTMSTIHHYEKIVTTYDDVYFQKKVVSVWVDEDIYNSLMTSTTQRTFPDGTTITQEIGKKAVSIYNYEMDLNESKRRINIIKQEYVMDTEREFKQIMQSNVYQ